MTIQDNLSDIQEFRNIFLNEIALEAQADVIFNEQRFIERAVNIIAEDGLIDDNPAFIEHSKKPTKIHAYTFSELDGSLSLFIANFFHVDQSWQNPQPLSEVNKFIERPKRFVEKSLNQTFLDGMYKGDSDYEAAKTIQRLLEAKKVKSIKIYYLTDGFLSERTKQYKSDAIALTIDNESLQIPIVVKPYGIRRFYDMDSTDAGVEDFTINFKENCGGLDGLATNLEGLQSFMVVMPGTVLREVYSEIGQKLLESNVRNFLNFTGKTNRGIKETLLKEPEKFFAYNNGLTVTATNIEAEYSGTAVKINSLENMQIVNGGQTTCVIFFAPTEKNFKDIDLSQVYVPMKLTIINAGSDATTESLEEADLFKSNVARYANTQNAVNEADLMSNSPFHIRLEQASRRTASPLNDLGISNHWFYERTKGQWNTQKRLSPSSPQFVKKFPRNQVIQKADLARFENTWRTKPFDVSKGAMKNLKSFYEGVQKEYRDNENRFRDQFFKALVAKKIIYNKTERIISNSDWFISTTYLRPFITTYSLALMLYKLRENQQDLNLDYVWSNQSISPSLERQLSVITKLVNDKFMDDNFRNQTTYREWAVKEDCWKKFIKVDIDLSSLVEGDILSVQELHDKDIEDKEIGELGGTIENIENLIKVTKEEYIALIDFHYEKGFKLTDKEISLPTAGLNMHISGKIPTDRQLKALMNIYNKAYEDGFMFHIKES